LLVRTSKNKLKTSTELLDVNEEIKLNLNNGGVP
jgi:hypothetical protein